MQQQIGSSIGQIRQNLNQASQMAQQLAQTESSNHQMAMQAQHNPQSVSSAQMGMFASREANAAQKLRQVNQLIQEISQDLNKIQAVAPSQHAGQTFQQPGWQNQGAWQQPFAASPGAHGVQPQGIQQGNIYQQVKHQTAHPNVTSQVGFSTNTGQGQPLTRPYTPHGQAVPQQGNIYQQLKQQSTQPPTTGQMGISSAWGHGQQAQQAATTGNTAYGQARGNVYQQLKQQTTGPQAANQVGVSSQASVQGQQQGNIYRNLKQQTTNPSATASGKIGFQPSVSGQSQGMYQQIHSQTTH